MNGIDRTVKDKVNRVLTSCNAKRGFLYLSLSISYVILHAFHIEKCITELKCTYETQIIRY